MGKKRVLSGMRPTGQLHLGNLVGALENWVHLQEDYETFFFAADWHVLTTSLNDTTAIGKDTLEAVIDWLSAGIDPEKSTVFIQSKIKEHAELFLLFSMLITMPRLERNPTLKEQVRDLKSEIISYGHFGYPVLQAADIVIYKADIVPVGEDQVPHVEITREIVRKFNSLFGNVFPEPQPKLTVTSRLPGLDGKKMSKSLNNAVYLSDSPEEIFAKVRTAVTDPQKIRRNDPGHPEVCNVFAYHKKFNPDEIKNIEADCKKGILGCVDCKKNCAAKIADYLAPIRDKREYYKKNMDTVKDIIDNGNKKAAAVAAKTMQEVHEVMHIG